MRNIYVEAEMGRIEVGEDGVSKMDLEAIMTQPQKAAAFVRQTGIQPLAPVLGNIPGDYAPEGPIKYWHLSR